MPKRDSCKAALEQAFLVYVDAATRTHGQNLSRQTRGVIMYLILLRFINVNELDIQRVLSRRSLQWPCSRAAYAFWHWCSQNAARGCSIRVGSSINNLLVIAERRRRRSNLSLHSSGIDASVQCAIHFESCYETVPIPMTCAPKSFPPEARTQQTWASFESRMTNFAT